LKFFGDKNFKNAQEKMFQVQLVERGRCEKISTLHLSPPAFASASLTENTEPSVIRLALDTRKRIRPAKGGSMFSTESGGNY
jgi:hypothetical protein